MTTKRRTAPEIIGFHFGSDMRDISESRYQPTRYSSPAIYTIGNDYYAAPSDNRPPRNMPGSWKEIAEYYGRKIYCLESKDRD